MQEYFVFFFIITESELNVEVKSGVRTIAHQGRKFLGWGWGGGRCFLGKGNSSCDRCLQALKN